jgi:hypothetical protein
MPRYLDASMRRASVRALSGKYVRTVPPMSFRSPAAAVARSLPNGLLRRGRRVRPVHRNRYDRRWSWTRD